MAETERKGLPMKPGQGVGKDMAEGLVEDLSKVTKVRPQDLDEVLEADKMSHLPTEEEYVPPELIVEKEEAAEEEEGVSDKDSLPFCPRCGQDLSVDVHIEPDPEDKQNFVRAILTNSRWHKAYSLFNDQVRVTFRSRVVDENDDVQSQLQLGEKELANNLRMLYIRGIRLSLAYSIKSIIFADSDGKVTDNVEYPIVSEEEYPSPQPGADEPSRLCVRAHSTIFSSKHVQSEALFNAIYSKFQQFDTLTGYLVARADDPDFWKATPSVA